MMKKLIQINAIGTNVAKETFRNKGFIILCCTAFFMLAFAHILGNMSIGGHDRVIQNTGFWTLGLWGLISAIFIGANSIRNEITQRTIYLILSRQVGRTVFMLGKFWGLLQVQFLLFACIGSAFTAQLLATGVSLSDSFFIALIFVFMEWVLLSAFSLFFASFTTTLLSVFFLSAIYFTGHLSKSFYILAENTENIIIKKMVLAVYYLMPNLEAMNFRGAALYGEVIITEIAFKSIVVSTGWTLCMLTAGILIFQFRRLP